MRVTLATAALLAVTTPAFAQSLPDDLDVVIGPPGGKSNVQFLLDGSSSMNSGNKDTNCSWYAATYTGGDRRLNQIQQLKATLIGCQSSDDGILDRYFDDANFSIRVMQSPPQAAGAPTLPWGVEKAAAEAIVAGISVSGAGNTPVTQSLYYGAQDFNLYWNDGNTPGCAKNFFVLVADGNSNGSGVTFNQECSTHAAVAVGANNPEVAARYLSTQGDMLCGVEGGQTIQTFAVGIDPQGGALDQLQLIAQYGKGSYFTAHNQDDMAEIFESVVRQVAERGAVFAAAPTFTQDRYFAGTHAYVASFRPVQRGRFSGNLKKVCIFPRRASGGLYDPTDLDCLFKSLSDGKTLYTNPNAKDVWTSNTSADTQAGGAGAMLATGGAAPNLGTPAGTPLTPYRPRRVVTWRPGTSAYVSVQPSTWSSWDAWAMKSEHWKLLNRLHGYTYEYTGSSGDPVSVSEWPYADPVHGSSVVLRYATNCETSGNCWVVNATNDGMLHFVDSATGEESTALIPAEVWKPNGITRWRLRDIEDQPNNDVAHRYYLDGQLRLYHRDDDADGLIDSGEEAQLIFGLGRAGRGYYALPVSRFDGTLDATRNPVRPLLMTPGTTFAEMRDTWAAPWIGIAKLDGTRRDVAIFPSGHIGELDRAQQAIPALAASPDTFTPESAPLADAAPCALMGTGCQYWSATGYTDLAPMESVLGPYKINGAIAYRVHFASFDLDPNDRMELEDAIGNDAARYTGAGVAHSSAPWMNGAGLSGGWSEWVTTSQFAIRLVLNGTQTTNKGYIIDRVEYLLRTAGAPALHNPTIYVVDLARWNGTSPAGFTAAANPAGVMVRIGKACTGTAGTDTVCVDATTNPDLAYMTCPVSGEVSVLTVADELDAIYWGDECGQLFTAKPVNSGGVVTWTARRLLSVNSGDFSNQAVSVGRSKDVRKIFRKIDIVSSSCPGRKVVGLYFGTGNVQRPSALDELQNASLNDGRDIGGVFWDDGEVRNQTMGSLYDVSTVVSVDPVALFSGSPRKYGWYWRFGANERMLRDPFVFEGRAFFKSHLAQPSSGQCTIHAGVERIYAVDNCTAKAVTDVNLNGIMEVIDRKVWEGGGDIGGDILVLTPRDGPALITHGNLLASERAQLGAGATNRPLRLLNWRTPMEIQ